MTTAPHFLHHNINTSSRDKINKTNLQAQIITNLPQTIQTCLLSGPQTTTAPSYSPSSKLWHPTALQSTNSKPPERLSTTAGLSAPSRTKRLHKIPLDTQLLTIPPSQHYNKKLRTLSPATEGAGADPATPVRSATKRKALAGKAADPTASPTPGAESGRGKKKAAAAAKVLSEEVVERDDEDDEQSPAKKTKVDVGGEASEGQE